MRYMTLSAFLDAREETVANAQSALARALNHPDPGGRGVAFPAFGHGDRAAAVVDVGHPQHRDLRQTARLVQRAARTAFDQRSEEHTSELQSLMRISYAVFCLKKKKLSHHISTQLNTSRHNNK